MSLKTEQYLQKISQCLYDINKLIDAHIIEPIEIDKELDNFYYIEKIKLIKLTEERVGILDIIELNNNLPDNLVFNKNGTDIFKKQTVDALIYLSKISSKINHQRDFSSSVPITGIEEGPLKDFLDKYLIKNNKEKIESNNCWITKEKDNYLFDKNIVYIKSKDSDYAIIFDVVFSIKPQGGKIRYQEIIELCKKRKKNINKKAIQRALTGKDASLFKYTKFIQEPIYEIPLFVPMQNGKEIEFNNKK